MALVLEDGSGDLSTANSYYSVASAQNYFTSIGVTTFTGPSSTLEANLIRACYYMETMDWVGTKCYSTQPLEWPRRNVIDKNGFYVSATFIPLQIKQAQAELALRYLNGDEPLPDLDDTGRVIRERIDVIEIQYESGYSKMDRPTFPFIDALLKQFLKSSLNVELVRA